MAVGSKQVNHSDRDTADRKEFKARRLALLGMLLLALHPLFGITAVIGVLINHMQAPITETTVYESHRRWQLGIFWLALAAYALAAWWWYESGNPLGLQMTLLTVVVALLINLFAWLRAKALPV